MAKRHATFAEAAAAKEEAAKEEREVKARQPKPKEITSEADLHRFSTKGDLVEIWERRRQNPLQRGTPAVRITTPGQTLRWINRAARSGRLQEATEYQGWQPVHKTELKNERELFGVSFTVEGYVCRGEKQQECLMKMPTAVYNSFQKAKVDIIKASYKKLEQNMRQAAASQVGEEAAEVTKLVGGVKFGTESTTTDEMFFESTGS